MILGQIFVIGLTIFTIVYLYFLLRDNPKDKVHKTEFSEKPKDFKGHCISCGKEEYKQIYKAVDSSKSSFAFSFASLVFPGAQSIGGLGKSVKVPICIDCSNKLSILRLSMFLLVIASGVCIYLWSVFIDKDWGPYVGMAGWLGIFLWPLTYLVQKGKILKVEVHLDENGYVYYLKSQHYMERTEQTGTFRLK